MHGKMSIRQQIEYLKSFVTNQRYERFLSVLQNRTRYITIVIEDIFQGHNASAILRSCDCFGIQDVHCIETRNAFKPNDEIAMGSEKWLSIFKYATTKECYAKLKDRGYTILATSPHAKSQKLQDISLNKPIALVFGAEKIGLSDYALQHADGWLYIPMYGFTESFNVSVSAALCMYELVNKLLHTNIPYHLTEQEKEELLLQWLKNTIKDADKLIALKESLKNG